MKKLLLAASLLAVGCAAPRTSVQTADEKGTMVFKVKPSETEVSIDGSVVGKARDYDGSAKVMRLNPGAHVVKLSAPGYQDYEKRVYLSDTREVIELQLQKAGN